MNINNSIFKLKDKLFIVLILLPFLFMFAHGTFAEDESRGAFVSDMYIVNPAGDSGNYLLKLMLDEDTDDYRYIRIRRLSWIRRNERLVILMRKKHLNASIPEQKPDPKRKSELVLNDPYYSYLWGLKKINAEKAWDISTGKGVVVAVLDTGIDYNHPDIESQLWYNLDEIPDDGIDNDRNGYVDDYLGWDFAGTRWNRYRQDNDVIDKHGHGTHVSGIIAAAGGNSEGIIGVAPDAKILPVKVLDDTGWGGWAGVARGIKYAADMGANIINLSLGGWGYAHPDSFFYSMVSYAVNKGCVIVAAAGNSNTDVKYFLPANIPEVIAVSATTGLNDRRAHFSNYGSGIDVAAPGVNILSLRAADTGLNGAYSFLPSWDPQAEYRKLSGTSMAAPFVSGVAALLLADNPKLSSDEVRAKLRFSAEDLGAPGFDKYFGYGRLDAYEALIYGKPGYEDSLEIAVGEGQEKSQIKGVDINEVISMQEAQRQNQMDFTGYSPKENFQQPPGALK